MEVNFSLTWQKIFEEFSKASSPARVLWFYYTYTNKINLSVSFLNFFFLILLLRKLLLTLQNSPQLLILTLQLTHQNLTRLLKILMLNLQIR